MAYEYDAEEWRAATQPMTEAERAACQDASVRHSNPIMHGERDDSREEMRNHR